MDPLVLLNLMVEMAGLEEELASARAVLAHHGRRDRHLRELMAEYVDDTAEAAAGVREMAVALRRTEGRIKEIEDLLARKRGRLARAIDTRQQQALQDEILNLEAELDSQETEGLELLEMLREQDRGAGEARRDGERQAHRGTEEIEKMAAEADRSRAAEKEITQEIERLIGIMPTSEGRHVARLRTQYEQAVVRVQSGACGGCFSQLPIQQGLDAEQGRALVRCASCARYVVRKSWK